MTTHTVVPLAEISSDWSDNRPRAVITFDDAYRGALTAGLAELVKRNLPATVFVAPGFVGGTSFWWDVVADRNGLGLSAVVRRQGIERLKGKNSAVREWAVANGLTIHNVPAHETGASVEELLAAAATGLISFGSHTWSHPNLAGLDEAELESEMRTSFEWLRKSLPSVMPWLSYPYGLTSTLACAVAAKTGYRGAFLISGGWVGTVDEQTRFALPRINVAAGLSLRGFELRVSGLLS
jgi:peptidoglycan/xylan/chitin deacetylase (PgdA/CDA1 family)